MAYTLSVPTALAGELFQHLSNIEEMDHAPECDGESPHPRTCIGCWAAEAKESLSNKMHGISKKIPYGVVPAAPRIRDPWRGR